jgi:hypothetical protein
MGNSAQHFLGCNKALGQGCPPPGPLVLSQKHQGDKVNTVRVPDQAK